jgi:hypothetical protein
LTAFRHGATIAAISLFVIYNMPDITFDVLASPDDRDYPRLNLGRELRRIEATLPSRGIIA